MSESHNPYMRRRFSPATEQRLEEMRQILRETEPLAQPSALQQLDAEAIEDRRVFKRRFGHDWPLRFHREALVRLRQERDWTDTEIKLILYSGTLRRGAFGVKPDASIWLAILGGVLAVLMLLFAGTIGPLLIGHRATLTMEQTLRACGAAALYIGIAWIAYQLYIRPWRIQRRVSAAPAQGSNAN